MEHLLSLFVRTLRIAQPDWCIEKYWRSLRFEVYQTARSAGWLINSSCEAFVKLRFFATLLNTLNLKSDMFFNDYSSSALIQIGRASCRERV